MHVCGIPCWAVINSKHNHKQRCLTSVLQCMCRPMCEMLMGRLPPTIAEQAIKQLARFLTTSTMPSVTSEAAVLANSAGWMHPQLTEKHIIGPMLTRLEAELEGVPTLTSSPTKTLSKVHEIPWNRPALRLIQRQSPLLVLSSKSLKRAVKLWSPSSHLLPSSIFHAHGRPVD